MKRTFLITAMALALVANIFAQKNEDPDVKTSRFRISVKGGPQIRYQQLNGLNGFFIGGSGCFRITNRLNFTAQGFLLANQNEYPESFEKEGPLRSGYGGIGVQMRFLKFKSVSFYSDLALTAGGYTFDGETASEFKSFSFGMRIKNPVNNFLTIALGISNPFYFYSGDIQNKLYQRSPIFCLALEFGNNINIK